MFTVDWGVADELEEESQLLGYKDAQDYVREIIDHRDESRPNPLKKEAVQVKDNYEKKVKRRDAVIRDLQEELSGLRKEIAAIEKDTQEHRAVLSEMRFRRKAYYELRARAGPLTRLRWWLFGMELDLYYGN